MEVVFTKEEIKKAREVIKQGLLASAKSLEYFIKTETKLELGEDFFISKVFTGDFLSKEEDVIYLLTTELVGDLKGVSFLLFSENEVKSIMNSRYANKDFDEAKYKKKQDALLLEIDNIITAGVMSEFANAFSYRTYGGVPKLDIVSYDKALALMKEGTEKNEFILRFNAGLVSEKANVKAAFIWSVDGAFVEGVKKLS